MLRWLILRVIDSAEEQFGESLDYLRVMARASLGAFFKFVKLTRISLYRKVLPPDAFHVVRITAARHEDCGPCVQTTVNIAKKAGVSTDILRALIENRQAELPSQLADIFEFVTRVMRGAYDEGEYRERIRTRYHPHGDAALTEIALVLSAARTFPVTKRVLGYATSCKKVTLSV